MKAKLIETEELDHIRIEVSLQNLSLAFTHRVQDYLSFKILSEYTWWTSP